MVSDTIVYVGQRVDMRALIRTDEGDAWPRDRRLTFTVPGLSVDGSEIQLNTPGVTEVQVSAGSGVIRSFKIAALTDLRRAWTFTASCTLPLPGGGNWTRATSFVASSSTYHTPQWNGLPLWEFSVPRARLLLTGVQTDTETRRPSNGPVTVTTETRSLSHSLTQDHSSTVRYTENVLGPGGVERITTLAASGTGYTADGRELCALEQGPGSVRLER